MRVPTDKDGQRNIAKFTASPCDARSSCRSPAAARSAFRASLYPGKQNAIGTIGNPRSDRRIVLSSNPSQCPQPVARGVGERSAARGMDPCPGSLPCNQDVRIGAEPHHRAGLMRGRSRPRISVGAQPARSVFLQREWSSALQSLRLCWRLLNRPSRRDRHHKPGVPHVPDPRLVPAVCVTIVVRRNRTDALNICFIFRHNVANMDAVSGTTLSNVGPDTPVTRTSKQKHVAGSDMLEFENVSKSFWTGTRRKVILDRVSFRVELGKSLGVLAPNGTGKTTLINMMAGLEKPDEGVIRRECRVSFPMGFAGGVSKKTVRTRELPVTSPRFMEWTPTMSRLTACWMCDSGRVFQPTAGHLFLGHEGAIHLCSHAGARFRHVPDRRRNAGDDGC